MCPRGLNKWRSGFNRYRRTRAGPELTTEPGALWRWAEAAKRDIRSHDISFFFLSLFKHVKPYRDRVSVSRSLYTEGHGARDKGRFPRCTSHVRTNSLIFGAEYKLVLGIDNVAGTHKKSYTRGEHVMSGSELEEGVGKRVPEAVEHTRGRVTMLTQGARGGDHTECLPCTYHNVSMIQ